MGKQVDQGTRWESRLVTNAQAAGKAASRLPKTGIKNEPDIQIRGLEMHPAVAVEHWIKDPGKKKRRAVRYVAVPEKIFYQLLDKDTDHDVGYWIQAKSRQQVSVRTVLEGLLEWMKGK